jgi:hypothetical protein
MAADRLICALLVAAIVGLIGVILYLLETRR